jgi:hypothetical protein
VSSKSRKKHENIDVLEYLNVFKSRCRSEISYFEDKIIKIVFWGILEYFEVFWWFFFDFLEFLIYKRINFAKNHLKKLYRAWKPTHYVFLSSILGSCFFCFWASGFQNIVCDFFLTALNQIEKYFGMGLLGLNPIF